jgi:Flp pilus assembly protein TadG
MTRPGCALRIARCALRREFNAKLGTRNAQRTTGQSLVELALVAPILILLAMAAWDGGSVLREQVVLQQAARDGARVAATGYGSAVPDTIVSDAVTASAADLPALPNTPSFLTITRDPQSVRVQLRYAHALITPVLRNLWGGGQGTITLGASATFYLAQLTPVPSPVVLSTPMPGLRNPCSLYPASQSIQALGTNVGYWCTLRITVSSLIGANWQDNGDPNNQLLIYSTSPDPFASKPDPVAESPAFVPSGELADGFRTGNSLSVITSSCQAAGVYTVYFFDRGGAAPASSGSVTTYPC